MAISTAIAKGLPYRCEHMCDRLMLRLPVICAEEEETEIDIFEDNGEAYPSDDDAWDF